jgi:hypothetical protein
MQTRAATRRQKEDANSPTEDTPLKTASSTKASVEEKKSATSNDYSSYMWLASYFFFNLTLTLYNKAVLQTLKFGFPWTLTGIHAFFGTLGAWLLAQTGVFTPAKLSSREYYVMILFSVLYTINIAISNVSL